MARELGTFYISGSLERGEARPIDATTSVRTFSELLEFSLPYDGQKVMVVDELVEYVCIDENNASDPSAWRFNGTVRTVFGRTGDIVAMFEDYQNFYQPLENQRVGTANNVTFAGLTSNGDLVVNGDIIQNGGSYVTEVEEIYSKSAYIFLRDGATTGLAPDEYTGIEAILYDGINNGRLVFDSDGTARVGDVGDEQPLATRSEKDDWTDNRIPVWNAANTAFEDSGIDSSTVITTVDGVMRDSDVTITSESSTLNTVNDVIDTFLSSTSVEGFDIADNGDGTVTVAAGSGWVRRGGLSSSPLSAHDFSEATLSLDNNDVNFIYIEGNVTTPQITSGDSQNVLLNPDIAVLYIVSKVGTTLYISDTRFYNVDGFRRLNTKDALIYGYERYSGSSLSIDASNQVAITSGVWWFLNKEITTNGINTAGANTVIQTYRDGSGGFVNDVVSSLTPSFYDDGSGTLQAIGAGEYSVMWVSIVFDSVEDAFFQYATEAYSTLDDAISSSRPAEIPHQIGSYSGSKLVYKCIFDDTGSVERIIDLLVNPASGSSVAINDHNNLTGLDGGGAGYFGHHTNVQLNTHHPYLNTTNTWTNNQTAPRFLATIGMSIDGNDVYHAGNSNKSDVDWTVNNLVASGLVTAETARFTNISTNVAVSYLAVDANGNLTTNLAGVSSNLQEVTDQGNTTTNQIIAASFSATGGDGTSANWKTGYDYSQIGHVELDSYDYVRSALREYTDFDEFNGFSFVGSTSAGTNKPSAAGVHSLINVRHRGGYDTGINYGHQIAFPYGGTSMHVRYQNEGTWSSWINIASESYVSDNYLANTDSRITDWSEAYDRVLNTSIADANSPTVFNGLDAFTTGAGNTNYPSAVNAYGWTIRGATNLSTSDGTTQFWIPVSSATNDLYYRKSQGNGSELVFGDWKRLLTEDDLTVGGGYVTLETAQTISGNKIFSSSVTVGSSSHTPFMLTRSGTNNVGMYFNVDAGSRRLGIGTDLDLYWGGNDSSDSNSRVLHAGNYSSVLDSRYLQLTGGTMTGKLSVGGYDWSSRAGGIGIGGVTGLGTSSLFWYNGSGTSVSLYRNTSSQLVMNYGGTDLVKFGSGYAVYGNGSQAYLVQVDSSSLPRYDFLLSGVRQGGLVWDESKKSLAYRDYTDGQSSSDRFTISRSVTTSNNPLTVVGAITATGGDSTKWNTAYTYSQVGHLPLTGGSVTGKVTINSNDAAITAQATTELSPVYFLIKNSEGSSLAYLGSGSSSHDNISLHVYSNTLTIGGTTTYLQHAGSTKVTTSTTGISVTGTVTTSTTGNSSQWNTAYTYSQVGHLPLTGGSLTGAVTTNNTLTLTGTNPTTGVGQIRQYGSGSSGVEHVTRSMREYSSSTIIHEKVASGTLRYSTGATGDGTNQITFNFGATGKIIVNGEGNSSQWNTAYTNNHTHSNKTVLDEITSLKVGNWDTAYSVANQMSHILFTAHVDSTGTIISGHEFESPYSSLKNWTITRYHAGYYRIQANGGELFWENTTINATPINGGGGGYPVYVQVTYDGYVAVEVFDQNGNLIDEGFMITIISH